MKKESMRILREVVTLKREELLEYVGDDGNGLSDFGKGKLEAYENIYSLIKILD